MTQLRQRMSEDMKLRNLALNTRRSYLQQVSLFARHFGRSPDLLGREDVRTYQVYLTNEKKLSPGSIHTAIAALRFLYNVTLERDWTPEEVLPLPKKQEAAEAADHPQPRGSSAVPRQRPGRQTPRHPDHLLCRRLAHFGSGPAEDHRRRQPENGHPG